ncbi:MAG: hypothetical protein AAB522_00535, partial [Patescibacteria group bacterium]
MMIEKVKKKIQALQTELLEKEQRISKLKIALDKEIKKIADICRPICTEALKEYNTTEPLQIVVENIEIFFDFDTNEISLFVR